MLLLTIFVGGWLLYRSGSCWAAGVGNNDLELGLRTMKSLGCRFWSANLGGCFGERGCITGYDWFRWFPPLVLGLLRKIIAKMLTLFVLFESIAARSQLA